MPRNLIDAIVDLAEQKFHWHARTQAAGYLNNVQASGVASEDIFKDLLAGVTDTVVHRRSLVLDENLAYQGSSNNPPDIMFKGGNTGDAFEIKNADSGNSELQLNSSPPYAHLTSTNPRISEECRDCEPGWAKRDFFYGFGRNLRAQAGGNNFWLIQGRVFANDYNFYQGVHEDLQKLIRENVREMGYTSPAQTNELGRLEGLDSRQLGRGGVKLRIRAMWLLNNPIKDFLALPEVSESSTNYLTLHIVMLKTKWVALLSQASSVSQEFISTGDSHLLVSEFTIDDPHNQGARLDCVLIRVFED